MNVLTISELTFNLLQVDFIGTSQTIFHLVFFVKKQSLQIHFSKDLSKSNLYKKYLNECDDFSIKKFIWLFLCLIILYMKKKHKMETIIFLYLLSIKKSTNHIIINFILSTIKSRLMGRHRNRNRKPKQSQKMDDLDISPVQSFTEAKEQSVTRSKIKNSDINLSEGSSFSVSDFQDEIYKRTVDFTIKQWLLLGMSRIVPHSDRSIRISMKRNEISGPKNKVQKFCKLAQNEIEEMKMKVLKFKYEISSDEIQFEMQKQWKCQVFTGKLLKNVAEKIQQAYDIKEEMKQLIFNILNKQGINEFTRFLWVQNDAYDRAYEILQRIHKQCARKIQQGQRTIVSFLKDLSPQSRSYQYSNKNYSSNNNSNQRTRKVQSESNQSADYSTIMNSKVHSKTQQSSSNLHHGSNKNQEKKKKKYEPKRKQEPTKYQTKSSMKNLRQFSNSFQDSDFTVIHPNGHQAMSETILSNKRESQRQQRYPRRKADRDDEQFQRRRPRKQNNQNQQRRPRRRQREGQEGNITKSNRYSQSQEGSVNQYFDPDNYTHRNNAPRQGNRQQRRNIIFTQEYPQQYFSKEHFKDWSKKNKTLKRTDQYTLQINQKFSPDDGITYTQVTFLGDDPNGDILYAINLYFNFEKLIKIQEQQQVRHKLIDKFQCKNNWLTVEYKKIFTRDRYPKYDDLRKLAKRDNTAQSMNRNKNVTHAFMMVGLVTQVSNMEGDIQAFIKEVKNTCRKVDIELKFSKINEFMRRKEVQNLIEQAITQQVARFPQRYKLHKITPTLAQILVEIELFKVQDRDVNRVKSQLAQRFERLIDLFEFDSDRYKNYKKAFETILKKFIIFQNAKNGLTLIAKQSQIKNQMHEVNKQIQKSFKNTVKQFTVKQKSQLTLCKDFLLKIIKQPGFSAVNYRFEQNDILKIVLIGPQIVVDNLLQRLEEYKETIESKISQYNISLKEQQLQILEKDKQFQKKIQEDFKITLKFKNDYKLGAVFVIEPHTQQGIKHPKKTIIFQNEFNFQSLPKNSVFFFRNQRQINLIKQAFILPLKTHIKTQGKNSDPFYFEDKIKQCFYIYGYEAQPQVILNSSKNTTSNNVKNIFMYTPEPLKTTNDFLKEMINKLCQNKDYLTKELMITIICRRNADLKRILSYKEGKITQSSKTKRNWYTLEGQTKLFYSDLGNKKIQEAYVNKVTTIQLNNQHLNLTNQTHQLHFSDQTMVHKQSGIAFPIKTHSDKITFTLDGVEKTIPDSEFKKIPKISSFWRGNEFTDCQLSIGFYKIDLNRLVQTNLFSKFQRKIGYDEVQIKQSQNFDLEVSYDVKAPKLCFQYSVENNENVVKKTQNFVKQTLQKKLINKVKPFNNQYTADLVQKFTKEAEQQNVSVEISQDRNSFILKSYNQKNIDIFLKILTHLSKTSKVDVTYPDEWIPQTQDIQTFLIAPYTPEFNKIQTAFTAGKITQLIRIQNKIVFKKFYEEKLFLKELNEGKDIKQMLLFHGTRTTDPKLIYQDKQECFNVNYTGQNNLLGRGTYFAQKSEYSVNYSHVENQMSRIKSMFYCRVLVGDSEKCPGHSGSIRDTGYKNQAKGIRYESMTDFLQGSNVYVVYKNRRAYPLYLIKYK